MKIHIKTTGLDLTPSFQAYIEQKLGVLAKFVKRFDELGTAQLWIEVARTTRHHQKGEVFMAEADLQLPKKMLHAVERAEDARVAVNALKNILRLEIEKYRTKFSSRPNRKANQPVRPGK